MRVNSQGSTGPTPPVIDPPASSSWWCLNAFSKPVANCDNLPTISTVYDRSTVNPDCGAPIYCWRQPTPLEVSFGFDKHH